MEEQPVEGADITAELLLNELNAHTDQSSVLVAADSSIASSSPAPSFKDNCNYANTNSHEKKSFECLECGKVFSYVHYYRLHMRLHSGDKRYTCAVCDKACINIQALKIHAATHGIGAGEFPCSVCDKVFEFEHARVHHEAQNHSKTSNKTTRKRFCHECLLEFVHYKSYWEHMRKEHSGLTPFHCEFCEEKFAISKDLASHLRSKHRDQVAIDCDLCEKNFSCRKNLIRHRKVVHKVQNIPKSAAKRKSGTYTAIGDVDTAETTDTAQVTAVEQTPDIDTETNQNDDNNINQDEHASADPLLSSTTSGIDIDMESEIQAAFDRFRENDEDFQRLEEEHGNGGEDDNDSEEGASPKPELTHEEKLKLLEESITPWKKGKKSAECEICKQTFAYKYNLEVHMQARHAPDSLPIFKCSQSKKKYMAKHRDEVACDLCGEVQIGSINLDKHKRRSHKKQCFLCKRMCKTVKERKNHYRHAHGHLHCRFCDKLCTEGRVRDHEYKQHKEQYFEAKQLDKNKKKKKGYKKKKPKPEPKSPEPKWQVVSISG